MSDNGKRCINPICEFKGQRFYQGDYCIRCGSKLSDKLPRCECGELIDMTVANFCRKCGKQIKEIKL